jgi:hypothetical protein
MFIDDAVDDNEFVGPGRHWPFINLLFFWTASHREQRNKGTYSGPKNRD